MEGAAKAATAARDSGLREMGKRKRNKVEKNKTLDAEASAPMTAVVAEKAVEFHCFRCDCAKKAKRRYIWKTTQGGKQVCNGCHGFLHSLVMKKA